MNTAITQTSYFRSIFRKSLLMFAIASMVTAIAMAPAFAKDHGDRQGNGNNGRGNGWRNDNRGYNGNHGYSNRGHNNWGGRYRHHQSYYYRGYQQPYIYAPPPVYYPPYQSPGINLVFPLGLQ